jgi:Signal transduction histidine kinase
MTIKSVTILAVAVLLAGVLAVLCAFGSVKEEKLDPVAVNDIAQSLAEQWNGLNKNDLPCRRYKLDYAVFGGDGKLIAETRRGLDENMDDAVRNRDTIVDIARDGRVYGKLVIYNDAGALWDRYRTSLQLFCIGTLILLLLFLIFYSVYIDRRIFRPFRALQAFAGHVAAGNLDIPLKMDRGNLFGAFTESFDLMRDELSKARESERAANESKKELVASLSHDIKTPVASIKAVSEIMMVKSHDEDEKRQLKIINSKADQINSLITNMFTATLEELQRLNVAAAEQPSSMLLDLIKNADYNNSAAVSPIPECIVLADRQRLSQVIDNVVSNSYKYAGTPIDVAVTVKGQCLEVEFKDFGRGVSADELPLLFHKYYRAKNAAEKSGAGLGLYISKYLMNQMSGDITCRNTEDGFAVTLKLLIA